MEADRWDDLVRNDEGTRQARKALGAEIVLDLDTTVRLSSYEGTATEKFVSLLARVGEVCDDAWKVAFLSYMEACELAHELDCEDTVEQVMDLIRWCRQAVGLSEEFATSDWSLD